MRKRNIFLTVLEAEKSLIKAPAGLVPKENLVSASKMASYCCIFQRRGLLCPHMGEGTVGQRGKFPLSGLFIKAERS
jgi:hypothetical protein